MSGKKILFTFPTAWDRKQLEMCRPAWEGRYEPVFAEPSDEECPASLDPLRWLDGAEETWRGRIDGVTSSSDYPGATLAAALAERLGLPGSPAAAILRASHKYYSRVAQREAVPEATPGFELVEAPMPAEHDLALGYPCFVKPIKGAFSIMSGKVRSRAELESFLARPSAQEFLTDYVAIFNRLVGHLTDFSVDGSRMLAEEFMHGLQVTVEGWILDGRVTILGVVDSLMHPDYPSFARFDHPSVRRAEIQQEMAAIAERVVRHLELDHTLFNIEMIYEPVSDRIRIIEINPRLCGQFADLYLKVDGVSSYQIALALAAGEEPPTAAGGATCPMASSFPLRTYQPVHVRRAPTPDDVAAAEALFPGTLVWLECADGQDLSDFEAEDGWSSRYAIVNLGGASRSDLRERLAAVVDRLGLVLEPL